MDRMYEVSIARSLASIAKSAERAADALEKLSSPGGQDREEDNMISICLPGHSSAADRKALGDVIRGILSE